MSYVLGFYDYRTFGDLLEGFKILIRDYKTQYQVTLMTKVYTEKGTELKQQEEIWRI